MCAKRYITENCYIDTDLHRFVRADTGATQAIRGPLMWRFVEYYLREGANRTLSKEEFAQYVYDRDDPDQGQLERIHIYRVNLKGKYAKLGLAKSEFEEIFQLEKNIGYRFAPRTTRTEVRLTLEEFSFMSKNEISTDDLTSMIDCMLFQGVSGKMGRHTLMALANAENPLAMFEVGELYYYGYITDNRKPDFKEAYNWYLKASEKNHPGAAWSIGYMMVRNIYPHVSEDSIDYGTALAYLEKAMQGSSSGKASAAAMTTIGELWEKGKYPAPDFSVANPRFEPADINKALKLYNEASEKGYHYATNRLALLHEKGKLYEDAFNYYKKSAQLIADGYTYNKLGLMLEKGLGCKQDVEEACEYYLMSVEKVFPDDVTPWGMFNAARVYACLIPNQPEHYLNLTKSFDLFISSMERLPLDKIAQILSALLDVFLYKQNGLTSSDAALLDRNLPRARAWANRYLETYPNSESASTIRNKLESVISQFGK